MNNCRDCRYFVEGKSGYRGGCHRYPPTVIQKSAGGELKNFTEFPNVDVTMGCGEWQFNNSREEQDV